MVAKVGSEPIISVVLLNKHINARFDLALIVYLTHNCTRSNVEGLTSDVYIFAIDRHDGRCKYRSLYLHLLVTISAERSNLLFL
jgi:hypothetical protein